MANAPKIRRVVAICISSLLLGWVGLWLYLDLSVKWTLAVRPAVHLVIVGIAIYGLAARTFWGRWLVVGLSLGGIIQGALVAPFIGPWWFLIVAPLVVPLAALLALLAGSSMKAQFEGRRSSPHNRWDLTQRPVRVLAWTVVLNIAAAPMLMAYLQSDGWWIGGFARGATLATLLVLVLALVLVIVQRTAGLLLIGLAGLAMVWIAGDAIWGALSPPPPELERGGCMLTPKQAALAGSLPAIAALLPGAVAAVVAVGTFWGRIRAFVARSDS